MASDTAKKHKPVGNRTTTFCTFFFPSLIPQPEQIQGQSSQVAYRCRLPENNTLNIIITVHRV